MKTTAQQNDLTFPAQSIPERFQQWARQHAERKAIGSGAWQPTYAELNAAANRIAHGLSPHGQTGDRVALLLPHDSSVIAAVLGVLKAGRVAVVLNPNDPAIRWQQILADSEPAIVLANATQRNLITDMIPSTCAVHDVGDYTAGSVDDPQIQIPPDSLAFLIYTSGTTGRPKGVTQTHRNLIHNAHRLTRGLDLQPDDRIALLATLTGGQGVSTTWCALLNGATLCPFPVPDRGVTGLAPWINDHQVTVYVSAASLFRHFVRTLRPEESFPSVRVVRLASEPATAADFAAYRKHFSDRSALFHTLSSSETGNITQYRLTRNDSSSDGLLPAGRAAEGIEIRLLDERGHEVPEGDAGEIVVRSRYLSPGYWRNESLTAERFSSDASADGVRLFRTGDRARRVAGQLQFLGRADNRVKIRGYRIELSEVEAALNSRPEVEQAFVCARDNGDGDMQLAAYIVPKRRATQVPPSDPPTDSTALQRALREALPGYMVPATFVFLDSFPLNAHGKIDRERLLQSDGATASETSLDPPSTPTEQWLAEVWREVLPGRAIDRHGNFFHLGGDSLKAAVISARLYAAFGIDIGLRAFDEHAELRDLAAAVDRLRGAATNNRGAPIVPISRTGPLPLSFVQDRTWRNVRTAKDPTAFSVAVSYRITGPLDVDALRSSLASLDRRHEILRTTFHELHGEAVQTIHPESVVPFTEHDLMGASDAEEQAAAIFRQEARKGFDLSRLPLLRFTLVRVRENEFRLLRVNHHIISDPWSWTIYFRELAELYEAARRKAASPLTMEPLQYADYAAWQRRELAPDSAAYREAIGWWRDQFADRPRPIRLPFRRLWRNRAARPEQGQLWWGVDPAISHQLNEIGRLERTTYYATRLATFAAFLSEECNAADLLLLTYMTTRTRVELQGMFGYFANNVLLRLRRDGRQTFRQWLAVVRQTVNEAHARSEIPYDQLWDELRKDGLQQPKTKAVFNVVTHTAPMRFGDLEWTWLDRLREFMPLGFNMIFNQHHEADHCQVTFDAHVHDPEKVRKFLQRFTGFLETVSREPDRPMGELC